MGTTDGGGGRQRVASRDVLYAASEFGMRLTRHELRKLVEFEPPVRSDLPPWWSPLSWHLRFDAEIRVVSASIKPVALPLGILDPWIELESGRVVPRDAATSERALAWLDGDAGQRLLNELWSACLAIDSDDAEVAALERSVRRELHRVQRSGTC